MAEPRQGLAIEMPEGSTPPLLTLAIAISILFGPFGAIPGEGWRWCGTASRWPEA